MISVERLINANRFAQMIIENPFILKKRNYIFVLSHMRSRSTLLSHILGSHDEICGYSESHQVYLTKRDLIKLNYHVYKTTGIPKPRKFTVDKILHNTPIEKAIAENPRLKVILMARNPKDTFASIYNMGVRLKKSGSPEFKRHYQDQEWIYSYYCNRLDFIEKFSAVFQGKTLYIDSEDIVSNTSKILADLADFLNLSTPLSEKYKIFSQTGQPHFGDISDAIKSGEIVKDNEKDKEYLVEFNQPLLSNATSKYLDFRNSMLLKHGVN